MIDYRQPKASDGAAIWQLTQSTAVLDLNSPYAYMLLGEHFAETCRVAVDGDKIVGFVSAYLIPHKPDTLFFWQVGVDSGYRGKGIALQLLKSVLDAPRCAQVKWLETTITPDNQASQKLFLRLAQQLDCAINETPNYFPDEFFPGDSHLAESLYRLGPL